MKKHIWVLYTGGTIGMNQSADGLKPDTALVDSALTPFADRLDFSWHICQPLIDSSAVSLANWRDWLELVKQNLPHYDGVLILHGTDTLAYSANMFALALPKLNKPVVLTGAQWPFGVSGSDAPLNLATAVAAFDLANLQQVVLAFNGSLFPAVGSSKVSTETAAGFQNAHFGALGHWSNDSWHLTARLETIADEKTATGLLNQQADVACYTLVPGMMLQHITTALTAEQPPAAVILQSYGHGNAPNDAAFIEAVRRYTNQGGLLLNISQVMQGCAAAVYAQGSALRTAGAVSGGKCNLETATVLLTLAASNGWNAERLTHELKRLCLV